MNKELQRLSVRLGMAFRAARRARGLSQAQVAEQIDLAVNFVARVERGERLTSVPKLFDLARLLDVSLDAVVFGKAWASELVGLVADLDENGRDIVKAIVRGVVPELRRMGRHRSASGASGSTSGKDRKAR